MKKEGVKGQLRDVYQQFLDSGGLQAVRSGDWMLSMVQRSLSDARPHSHAEVTGLRGSGLEVGIRKLTHAAARRAALAGMVAAGVVSADEIVALLTAGEGVVGLPANIAFAAASVCAELFYITRLQVKLVQQIGMLYGVESATTNSDDVITAFAIALGGLDGALAAGFADTREQANVYLNEILSSRLKAIARKIGSKLVRRSFVKATIPIASIGMSASGTAGARLAVAEAAKKHFAEKYRQIRAS